MAPPQDQKEIKGSGAETELTPASIRELLEKGIAEMDGNPNFSLEEKNLAIATIGNLGLDALDERINTREKLIALRAEITQDITRYKAEKLKLSLDPKEQEGRRDIPDLAATLAGTLRRFQIERRMDKLLKGVETVDDLRKLSVDKLIALEKKHEGILLYAFTDISSGDTKIDLQNFYFNPKSGTMLRIDFRGNKGAESEIGAADLCPPSVRRITCYSHDNMANPRTSIQRIGLKGENKEGNGFFDSDGYMAIYSGDLIVLGGIDNSDRSGVDVDFDKKYRQTELRTIEDTKTGEVKEEKVQVLNEESERLYQQDHGKDEADFIEKMKEKGVRITKRYTPEELLALEAKITATMSADGMEVRKSIVKAVMKSIGEHAKRESCWDWVEQVYKAVLMKNGASLYETKRTIYRHPNHLLPKEGPNKFVREKWLNAGRPKEAGFDDEPKNPPEVAHLAPGDWIFIHNGTLRDRLGDHSVIFLGWIGDPQNMVAQVAAYRNGDVRAVPYVVNLNEKPVTWITKPLG